MLLKITIWAIFAVAIAVKIYTKKVQNIDGSFWWHNHATKLIELPMCR